MIQELSENELDISMAQGFLDEWLKDSPGAVKDNLKTLADGVTFYRDKFIEIQEGYTKLQENYNQLAALSSSYLALLNQQKEQIDQLLIEEQRDFHRGENKE